MSKASNPPGDSQAYVARKSFYDSLLTIYGRKPVLEALLNPAIKPYRLHLADSNQADGIIRDISREAAVRNIEVRTHSRQALARISRNGRQDQGVALDVAAPGYQSVSALCETTTDSPARPMDVIALDRVTNPQNLGMIIRSVGASPCDGLLLPQSGSARLDPLVIKASAGTLFQAPIYFCRTLEEGLLALKAAGFSCHGLAAGGEQNIASVPADGRHVFILGNETSGLDPRTLEMCDDLVTIPLAHGIESLNVSAAASVVAFRRLFAR